KNGVCETRVCSTYSAVNIVKAVIKTCMERRRRLTFVKDSENEYCSDLFVRMFEEFALPLSNFRLLRFSIDDITREMYDNPSQFDTVFASKSFADFTGGLLRAKLGKKVSIYSKFLRSVPVYAVKAIEGNSYTENYLPSLASYVTAFGDMLRDIFGMEKEAAVLRNAVNEALNLEDYTNPEAFFKCIEENLNNPVTTKYPKRKKPH
ncbi:MAG: hypothetical protein IJ297_07690, partial [Clostridia bacterium]|nr:hypothetical protein [Clostridia bacterium]